MFKKERDGRSASEVALKLEHERLIEKYALLREDFMEVARSNGLENDLIRENGVVYVVVRKTFPGSQMTKREVLDVFKSRKRANNLIDYNIRMVTCVEASYSIHEISLSDVGRKHGLEFVKESRASKESDGMLKDKEYRGTTEQVVSELSDKIKELHEENEVKNESLKDKERLIQWLEDSKDKSKDVIKYLKNKIDVLQKEVSNLKFGKHSDVVKTNSVEGKDIQHWYDRTQDLLQDNRILNEKNERLIAWDKQTDNYKYMKMEEMASELHEVKKINKELLKDRNEFNSSSKCRFDE